MVADNYIFPPYRRETLSDFSRTWNKINVGVCMHADIERAMANALRRVRLEKMKRNQRRVIETFVSERDVFVLILTAYGKSFCYVKSYS